MLHAYIQRFDMMDTVEKILGTKNGQGVNARGILLPLPSLQRTWVRPCSGVYVYQQVGTSWCSTERKPGDDWYGVSGSAAVMKAAGFDPPAMLPTGRTR